MRSRQMSYAKTGVLASKCLKLKKKILRYKIYFVISIHFRYPPCKAHIYIYISLHVLGTSLHRLGWPFQHIPPRFGWSSTYSKCPMPKLLRPVFLGVFLSTPNLMHLASPASLFLAAHVDKGLWGEPTTLHMRNGWVGPYKAEFFLGRRVCKFPRHPPYEACLAQHCCCLEVLKRHCRREKQWFQRYLQKKSILGWCSVLLFNFQWQQF